MTSNWFQAYKANVKSDDIQHEAITLYTFHHAGGSCQYFQPWVKSLPSWIELVSVQLPGRWNRASETAFLRMSELTPILGEEFKKQLELNPGKKFAFYGHSLGGLVAYDLTRYLTHQQLPLPVHLFISSKRDVQNPSHIFPVYQLPMPEFEKMVAQLYGELPSEITADPDMKTLFLNITKKDMELLDTYVYNPEIKINVPLTIIGGKDDHVITLETLQGWQELTSGEFKLVQLPGGHFFLRESEASLLKLVVDTITKYV